MFLGDSVTRYEFLSFIHFLEFGKYPTPRWGLKGGRGRGSPVIEREWGSWQSYFTGGLGLHMFFAWCSSHSVPR